MSDFAADTCSSSAEVLDKAEVSLDGSQGEGGGQILRTAVSLAAILGKSLRIRNIRAGRPKPGLAAQHLAGINLMGQISEGSLLSGNEMKSTELSFVPGIINGEGYKSYSADPHTAGSITLMIQIALPCLLHCVLDSKGTRELELRGGTNVMASPPIEHSVYVLLPLLERMLVVDSDGAGSAIGWEVSRSGWFPKGGGRVVLRLPTPMVALKPLSLTARCAGEMPSSVTVFVSSQVPESDWSGVIASLKVKLQSSFEEVIAASMTLAADMEKEKEGGRETTLDIVVNPFGNAPASIPNQQHQHKKKRHKKGGEGGGGGGGAIPTKQCIFALSIVVRYRSGAVLYTNVEDLPTVQWSAASEAQVESAFAEIIQMVQTGACLDERTADQLLIYNAMALLWQRKEAMGMADEGDRNWKAAVLIGPPNERSSSQHLVSVKEIIKSFIEDIKISITVREDGCREVVMELS